jgi:hypothetical protein
MSGYWIGFQTFHRNVTSTLPADAVFTVIDVLESFLDHSDSQILPIAHALRKTAIDKAGSSINMVGQAIIQITQTVKITVLTLL